MSVEIIIHVQPNSRSVPVDSFVGIPAGGLIGQVIGKSGAADFEVEWVDPPAGGGGGGVPPGGTIGQVLAKVSGANYATQWVDPQAGPQGPAGAKGDDGADGANGLSAYQVAVANGFVGTEAAWLVSLKGEPGDDGVDGSPGAPGADGANGLSAYQVAVANGFVGTEAAWLASLKGEPGDDGADGAPGADGANGLSAYQVAVANGFVGTEAAWLASLKGEPGDDGAPGGDAVPGSSSRHFFDFPQGVIEGVGLVFSAVNGGSANTAGTQSEDAGAFGTRFISCSTSANSGAYINPIVTGGNGFWLAAGNTLSCRFRLKFLSTLLATTKVRFGFQGAFSTADEASEVSFVVDGGAITGRCRSSSSQTSTTGLGSVTSNVWMGFKIDYTSTSVVFSVYNNVGALIATETLTANIPTNINKTTGVIATNSGTTAGKILGIDYIYGEFNSASRAF